MTLFAAHSHLYRSATLILLVSIHLTVLADVKVAFIGDQGTGSSAQAVLQLVAAEEADILLIQGDLGYVDGASGSWESNLDQFLGEDFPVLSVVGNHENFEWPAYQSLITDRINRIGELNCEGDYGVKALCSFRDLEVVQIAPGVSEVDGVSPDDDYNGYILDQFSGSTAVWRICSWHKNQARMQIGGKPDETGWEVYQACLSVGGIIATGHEHSYSRTHLMNDFERQSVVHTNDHLEIDEGQSFAFVSGLGGRGIRDQEITGDWWASEYSSTQNASFGALFCTFGEIQADCYFKDIAGAVPDTFTLESRVNSGENVDSEPVTISEPPPTSTTGVIGYLTLLVGLVLTLARIRSGVVTTNGRT